jgi:2-desacetyl-2-hydroxyethyl bacteriochlorophyllide A dehydrogenase
MLEGADVGPAVGRLSGRSPVGEAVPSIVFAAPNVVEIREVELPDLGPRDVRIRTVCSGVSQGTERWLLTDRYRWAGGVPQYPHFPGYQAAGVVEAVGPEVDDLRPGDRAFAQGTRFAGREDRYGLGSHTGALVQAREDVVRLDAGVDLGAASLLRMAGVSRHGVRLTGIDAGDLVVVIGQGMIGQMSAQAARARGARVIASDVIDRRLAASAAYSADRVVDASVEDLADVVRVEAPDGADVVIDTTGISGMFATCIDLVRAEGRVCLQGYYPDPIEVRFHPTHLKRPTVTFPCWVDREDDGRLATELAVGGLMIEPLITHRIEYTDAAEAFDLVVHHPERSLGMVLEWSEE